MSFILTITLICIRNITVIYPPQHILQTSFLVRMRLLHRRQLQKAEMLMDQSVIWLRKVTNWWCDSGGEISV